MQTNQLSQAKARSFSRFFTREVINLVVVLLLFMSHSIINYYFFDHIVEMRRYRGIILFVELFSVIYALWVVSIKRKKTDTLFILSLLIFLCGLLLSVLVFMAFVLEINLFSQVVNNVDQNRIKEFKIIAKLCMIIQFTGMTMLPFGCYIKKGS